MRRAAASIAIVLLCALGAAPALAAPPRAGFDLVPLAIGIRGENAPLEPAYAPASSPAGDTAYIVHNRGGERLDLREASGVIHALVGVGDPLAGSTITDLAIAANALDAYQQVLFWAALADGRAGLFRASPPPAPFSISPTVGYRDQPVTIQLIGRGFAPGVRVRVGSVDAGLITVVSPTELTGMLPAGAPLGTVDVAVSRPNGTTRTLRAAFEFRDRPPSGCRGFWPDHRPPDITAASVVSSWVVPFGVVAVPTVCRRFTRRWRARRRRFRTP